MAVYKFKFGYSFVGKSGKVHEMSIYQHAISQALAFAKAAQAASDHVRKSDTPVIIEYLNFIGSAEE